MKKHMPRQKLPTMYDVARLAGVSQPTVSRVLNQNDTNVQISEETRQRVLSAVAQLGYRPNVIARSLRTQRSQMIALMIADISNGFYQSMTRAVQDVARQYDYEVMVANSDHVYKYEKHFCDVVSRRSIDGVIMVPFRLTEEDINQFYHEVNAPITILGSHIKHPNIDVVYLNDTRAVEETIHWMIHERGYTRIGYVGVTDDFPPGPRRFDGFMRAMNQAGLTIDPRFMVQGDFTMESGKAAANKLLENGKLPRALFVLNDLMAIGVILALQDAGYAVPDDVAVIGFDDIPEATIVRPALTTIAQDPRDMGQKLARALFERIEDPSISERRAFESPYRLVIRQSG